MTPSELCDRLARPVAARRRDLLLAAAARTPECLSLALDRARALTSGTPKEAVRFAEIASEIARRRAEPAQAGAALRVRGQALRVMGRHEDAIQAFTSAAEWARQAGEPALAAQFQIGSIDSMGMLGRYDEAVSLARRLEDELRTAGSEVHAARALCNEGSVHFRRDRLQEALACYERAGEILERLGDELMSAAVAVNRANVLTQLSRLDDAARLYEQALAAYESHGLDSEAAVARTNLAYLEHVSGRPAAALALYRRALEPFDQSGRSQDAARCEIDAAESYRSLNLFPEALACSERALAGLKDLPLAYDHARAEVGRAAALMGMDRLDEALVALAAAERTFRRQRNPVQRAHVRLVRAAIFGAQNRSPEAVAEAAAAARAFAREGLEGWAAEAGFLLAEAAGPGTVRRLRRVSRMARETGRGWLECRAELALGRHYAAAGKTGQALRHLRLAAEVLERARTLISPEAMHVSFLRDKLGVYEELVSLLLARGRKTDLEEAFQCVERSRSQLLLERLRSSVASAGERAPGPLQERLRKLRSQLSQAQHLAHSSGDPSIRRPAPASIDQVARMERAYEDALRELDVQTAETPFRQSTPLRLAQLMERLGPDETLVEYTAAGAGLCAFTLSRSGLRAYPEVAGFEAARALTRRLRYHLQKMELAPLLPERARQALADEVRSVLGALYDRLLRPLETSLAGAQQVVVVPHGFLHGLPFHAFWDGNGYALDRWEFLYAPSAAVWHFGAAPRSRTWASGAPLLLGVPSPGIEGVKGEIETVAACLPQARVRMGSAATQAAFRREAPGAGVLHIATHARFRPENALFSALELADGPLLARDLYELRLDCDLATLSACQTGAVAVEPGDELFGLVRGFLAAGARSVAASLWPAHDAATAALMTRFYAGVAAGGSRAAALRQAQRATREQYPHPYHWAPFILMGAR